MSNNVIQRKARASSDVHHHTEEESGGCDGDDDAPGYCPPFLVTDGDGAIAVHTAIPMNKLERVNATEDKNMKAAGQGNSSKAGNDDKDSLSVKDPTLLWIFFQCLWPAVLMLCDDITMLQLLLPYAFTFVWFHSYGYLLVRGNILNEFINTPSWYKSFLPTIIWLGVYTLDESDSGESGSSVLILFVLLFHLLAFLVCVVVMGPGKIWILLSGKFDAFERWIANTFSPEPHTKPEDYTNEDEYDEESVPKDEIVIQGLERLEKLSKEGKLQKPTWVLVVLGIAAVWQFVFLLFFGDILVWLNIGFNVREVRVFDHGHLGLFLPGG